MSGAKIAAAGAKWTIGGQLFVSLAQFVVSGVTSRIFLPSDFGGFAAAVSLMGILALLTTTGLPSFILKEHQLSSSQVRTIRYIALISGLLTAILYIVVAPAWLDLLKASEGEQYIISMAIAQVLGPISGVESALLRREIKVKRDTITFLTAFVVSSGLGLIGAIVIREAWVLGIPLALTPIVLAISASCLQHHVYSSGDRLSGKVLFTFSRKIITQNLGFMLLQQAPGWAVSATMGAGALGHFSKGVALAQMPATALTAIQGRMAQPHWRNIRGLTSFQNAVCDAGLLSAGVAFPAFAFLSVNGSTIIKLWLGPGWELAGSMTSILAVGFAFSIPFTLMAGSLEMRGDFRPARMAQWAMAGTMLPPIAAMIMTHDVIWASRTLAIAQVAALICLISVVKWTSARIVWRFVQGLITQTLWAAIVACSGLLAVTLLPRHTGGFFEADLVKLAVAGIVSGAVWVVTFRWSATSGVLVRRGFRLHWFLRSSNA